MANSSFQIPLVAHNRTVKAWCLTGNFIAGTNPTQSEFDAVNFVDGFNLRLDAATQLENTGNLNYNSALKFSFITPMQDNKYKIFVRPYGSNPPLQIAHALNSEQYPKTTGSFWIRVGFFVVPSSGAPAQANRVNNQVTNISLWTSATSSIGVVVL